MRNFNVLIAFLGLALFASSCVKEEKSILEQRVEMISGKDWVQVSLLVDSNQDGTPETDVFAFMEDCDKDDVTAYNSDGTWTTSEGTTKCDAADPDMISNGTWVIEDAGETLKIIEDNGTLGMNATITEMTGTTMILERDENGSKLLSTLKARR